MPGFEPQPPVSETPACPLVDRARRLAAERRPAEAVAALRAALETTPDDPGLLTELAAVLEQDGELIPALQTYNRLIALDACTAEP